MSSQENVKTKRTREDLPRVGKTAEIVLKSIEDKSRLPIFGDFARQAEFGPLLSVLRTLKDSKETCTEENFCNLVKEKVKEFNKKTERTQMTFLREACQDAGLSNGKLDKNTAPQFFSEDPIPSTQKDKKRNKASTGSTSHASTKKQSAASGSQHSRQLVQSSSRTEDTGKANFMQDVNLARKEQSNEIWRGIASQLDANVALKVQQSELERLTGQGPPVPNAALLQVVASALEALPDQLARRVFSDESASSSLNAETSPKATLARPDPQAVNQQQATQGQRAPNAKRARPDPQAVNQQQATQGQQAPNAKRARPDPQAVNQQQASNAAEVIILD